MKIPSTPLPELLNFQALAQWVHGAHSKGLETYVSGGMRAEHVPLATFAGVDGVGIGFWCHHRDEISGAPGDLDPSRIKLCLQARNDAEASTRGIAARLMAQLDAAYFAADGRLSASCARLREDLFREAHSERDGELPRLIQEGKGLGFLAS